MPAHSAKKRTRPRRARPAAATAHSHQRARGSQRSANATPGRRTPGGGRNGSDGWAAAGSRHAGGKGSRARTLPQPPAKRKSAPAKKRCNAPGFPTLAPVELMADLANKYAENVAGTSTSMTSASTAISAARRPRRTSPATTTAGIPTCTSSPSPTRKRLSARKPWKAARSRPSARTGSNARQTGADRNPLRMARPRPPRPLRAQPRAGRMARLRRTAPGLDGCPVG